MWAQIQAQWKPDYKLCSQNFFSMKLELLVHSYLYSSSSTNFYVHRYGHNSSIMISGKFILLYADVCLILNFIQMICSIGSI